MPLRLEDFDYPLDPARIAQRPADRRDRSRLMVLRRADGSVCDHVFRELPGLLPEGALLVLNDTRVVRARLQCRRETGGRIEGLFLREIEGGEWELMLRGAGRCRVGEALAVEPAAGPAAEAIEPNEPPRLILREPLERGRWRVYCEGVERVGGTVALLERFGAVPLPPYIRREDPGATVAEDSDRYQTLYADRPGAVAAPTAGLHFTEEVFDSLAARGIETARVTLHVGAGTFAPVTAEDPAGHEMHSEWYEFGDLAAHALNAARAAGRPIAAVGTTSMRVLESVAREQIAECGEKLDRSAPLHPRSGWTDLFLYPPAEFHVCDALVTNFHLPKSTLLMLVSAFCEPGGEGGLQTLLRAYAHAAERAYRFYSYGDAMLIV